MTTQTATAPAVSRTRETLSKELAEKIESYRMDHGLYDSDLADLLDVSRQYWAKFRADPTRTPPGPLLLAAVAEKLPHLEPLVLDLLPFCRGADAIGRLLSLAASKRG